MDRYYDIDDDVRFHESVEKLQEVCEGLTLPRGGRETITCNGPTNFMDFEKD